MELQQLAKIGYKNMEWLTRDDGSRIVVKKDGGPNWLADMVYELHDGLFPDDWTYEQIYNALGMLSDGEDPEEAYFEGDTLTSSLFDWAKGNSSLVNDYIRNFGWGGNIEAAICGAQAEEERNIAIRVRDYLDGILDDFDDEDEWKDDDAIAEFVAAL